MSAKSGYFSNLFEQKMKNKALGETMALSLLLAIIAGVLIIYLFTAEGALARFVSYQWESLAFEIKKSLPLFKLTKKDAHDVALSWSKYAGDAATFVVAGWASVAVFIGSFVAIFRHQLKRKTEVRKEDVLRGSRLVKVDEHNRTMRKEFGKVGSDRMGEPMILGEQKAIVPEELQYQHFCLVGASGTGKSTAIRDMIAHALTRGHKGFVIDLKGDLYSRFGRPQDHILSLRDKRSEAWNFWVERHARPENMAAALVEEETTGNDFFWKSARAVLASLIRQNKSLDGLWNDLMNDTDSLRDRLLKQGEISTRALGGGKGDQSDGVIGSTVLDLNFLSELNQWADGKAPFSITKWMNDASDNSWVYVVFDEIDKEISKPLIRLWFDLAVIGALNRTEYNGNVHTWLIIDELKTVGQLPSLLDLLDKGRKFQASVVLGFQAFSQLDEVYGTKGAASIRQGLQNKFFFSMSDPESAKLASEIIGEQEINEYRPNISFGYAGGKEKGSVSKVPTTRKVVLADSIRNQPRLSCFAKCVNHNPFEIKFGLSKYPVVNIASQSEISDKKLKFVPRDKKPAPTKNDSVDNTPVLFSHKK